MDNQKLAWHRNHGKSQEEISTPHSNKVIQRPITQRNKGTGHRGNKKNKDKNTSQDAQLLTR